MISLLVYFFSIDNKKKYVFVPIKESNPNISFSLDLKEAYGYILNASSLLLMNI